MSLERDHDRLQRRADEILCEHQDRIFRRTDRMFAVLLGLQWLAAVGAALCLTPLTWDGPVSRVHPHVVLAAALGCALFLFPTLLILRFPGRAITRNVVAVAQVMFSSLLIHVTGGRIETHFHIFGSLAILAAYRDWKVLVPATAIVAVDHFVRGVYWPQSIFGAPTASPWRTVEHAAWVLFEDVFLVHTIRESVREMCSMSLQTAHLENNHAELEKYSAQIAAAFDKERAVIDGALDAVVQMDCNGRVTSWNKRAEQIFGWTGTQSLGRLAADVLLPERLREAHAAALQVYRETGHGPLLNERRELEGAHRDGHTFPIEIAVTPIHRGSEVLFCAFIRDITARKQYEEELQKAKEQAEGANRTKSEFLANMSHEIRTPLNGILGFTELLIRNADEGDEAERRDYIRTIRSSGKHLLELINDILDLSKIEAGQLLVEKTACSPHHLMAEVVSILRPRAQEKGIALDYRWETQIPDAIQSDPYRLRQLLMNLAGNAVKFTEAGSVDIVARLERGDVGSQLVIEVRDTGIGISPEHIDLIFKPFVQADNSMTRKFGGTGLGLTITKNICESLGGSLFVQSTVGQGSLFTAVLPTGDLSGVRMCERPPASGHGDIVDTREGCANLSGVSVLLADDGETNRKLIDLFLSRQGAKVAVAENGELAVAAATSQTFDVILMDMQMPVMDGYAATRKLRSQGHDLPIIALTAHAMIGDRKKCEDAGCSGYITKPVNVDELVRVVQAAARGARDSTEEVSEQSEAPADPEYCQAEIHSTLPMDDPEIRELVAEFAATVPERIEAIEQALEKLDFDTIASMAHALKGSGGTAGFACLTEISSRLESSAKDQAPDEIGRMVGELRKVNKRIVV